MAHPVQLRVEADSERYVHLAFYHKGEPMDSSDGKHASVTLQYPSGGTHGKGSFSEQAGKRLASAMNELNAALDELCS